MLGVPLTPGMPSHATAPDWTRSQCLPGCVNSYGMKP